MSRIGADLVVETLAAAGVKHLFTLSGNQILSVYDATIGRDIALIHTRHEAAAVHMADGWGRLTEQPGVALVTAGPGHCNALSALYVALMAESPVVLLSGHSPRSQRGKGAFQEMDQVAAAKPVTKAAWLVEDADALDREVATALALATAPPPGPVHLSLPSDLLQTQVSTAGSNSSKDQHCKTRARDQFGPDEGGSDSRTCKPAFDHCRAGNGTKCPVEKGRATRRGHRHSGAAHGKPARSQRSLAARRQGVPQTGGRRSAAGEETRFFGAFWNLVFGALYFHSDRSSASCRRATGIRRLRLSRATQPSWWSI